LFATSAPFRTPRTQQWNVGYQRMLYRRGSIDIGYVGAHGDRLIQQIDLNQADPAAVLANGLNISRPYVGYAGITMRQTTAYNNYKGLLAQFRHEGGRVGTYVLNYTLSRNRASATNDRDAADNPQNPKDLKGEYADARTDRRHIFTANYIYELPLFRTSGSALVKGALGGWQVSGITTLNSGAPISRVVANTNGSTRGSRANLVGDPKTGTLPFPYWFDPAAFTPPAAGAYGSPARIDPIRLPGRNQTDLALSKNFYPMARRLQFRADFINAFNHTQWLAVNNACSAAATVTLNRCDIGGTDTFGQITSARAAREIQLSLKLFW
jgi:hypothetical protein